MIVASVSAAVCQVQQLGDRLPWFSLIPFGALLMSIAILPLAAGHWWHSNRNKAVVTTVLAVPFALWLYWREGANSMPAFEHTALDYFSFMVLLGSLYVISGGIFVRGSLNGTPLSNTVMLGVGSVLANLIGTTGASMVLVRPLLRANATRKDKAHTFVFFIFIVSNCGGLLTPFADPPLYLGFLKGVPFEWTLRLLPHWMVVNWLLLILYFGIDSFRMDRAEKARPGSQLEDVLHHEPLGIDGIRNVLLLLAVVAIILAKGSNLGGEWPFGLQQGLMLLATWISYAKTPASIRARNSFSFGPINEVAILFAGIFITMVAPLAILNARGHELGITEPWQYFWATGALSGFLDNAPTYLAVAAVASGQAGIGVDGPHYLGEFLAVGGSATIAAISCGAVMMGALTYIGNGPNFMVKAIVEENGVRMPTFLGYMGWAVLCLVPCLAVVTFLFFRS